MVLQRLRKVRLEPEVCPWCKVRPAAEFDHIEAKANGGNNTAFNGMFICWSCNSRKSAMFVEDWLAYVRETYKVMDVELWINCKDRAEYDVMIGRKLRKQIGFRVSEPPPPFIPEMEIVPRDNRLDRLTLCMCRNGKVAHW